MCRSLCNKNAVEISGFELSFLIANSVIPHGVVRVIGVLANLAASTPNYFISRSHKRIAEEICCSESTVRRAFKWAVDNGMLIMQRVVHEKTNARLPNMYRFTPAFLTYARTVKAKLSEKKLTFFSPIRAVKEVIVAVRVTFNFCPHPPAQKEQVPPSQNDQAKNKNSSSRITKQPDPEAPDQYPQITRRELINEVAAAKSAGANLRSSVKHAYEQRINAIADKKAKGFAWVKWFKGKPQRKQRLPEPANKFDGLPTVTTVSEMLKRSAMSSFGADNELPDGFRG